MSYYILPLVLKMLSISSKRMILRDHLITDLDDMHEWRSDREIMRFVPGLMTTSREETNAQLLENIFESQKPERTKYYFAAVLKTGEIIGEAGFSISSRAADGGIANMGYFFKRRYWGNGYGTEAAQLMIHYCFDELGLHKVTSGCDKENKGSEKIMIKCGMKKEAEFIKQVYTGGVWRDRVEYAILRTK
jgi:[ribosomal protein S5]-alanine N-acetyltransferase